MNTIDVFENMTAQELATVEGGKVNVAKCYAGTIGSAVLGFGAMGPVGYWAGAGVGYASFC